jgi:hypothetical protein
MSSSQYSMRTLLIFVAVVAMYFPCAQVYDAWFHSRTRSNHSFHYVEMVLLTELRNGDTLAQVGKHFDNTKLVTPADVQTNTNIRTVWGNKGLPILPGDQFYFFSLSTGAGCHLQFRQGTLVNLWNTAYTSVVRDPRQLTRPNQFLAFGFFLGYLMVVVLGTIAILFLGKRRMLRPLACNTMHKQPG